jgi:hypothetical protein
MPKPYRIVAANLETKSIVEADRIAKLLNDEGWPRATRSLVIREALERLREDLVDKSAGEVFSYFIDRRGTRASRAG